MSSETISNELIIPDERKELGLSRIIFKGSEQHGFSMKIEIKDYPMFCPIKKDWNATLASVEKKVTDFNKKTVDHSKRIGRDLESALYALLFENQSTIMSGNQKTKENIINSNNNSKDGSENDEVKQVSITDAIRTHSGTIQTSGLISAITEPYRLIKREKFICSNISCGIIFGRDDKINILDPPRKNVKCPNCDTFQPITDHDWIDVKTLKVQSDDNTIETTQESLKVLIFNEDTKHVQIGEKITITGEMTVEEDSRNRKFHGVLLAQHVKYEDRKRLELTFEDIKAIKKFRSFPNYEKRLVSMFAPNLLGCYDDKLTILLAAVGAPTYLDKNKHQTIRGRINVLIIGPPGSGKTVLLTEALKLRITSKFVSGKNTTGPSLTVIIMSEDGQRTLLIGAAPRSAQGFLGINEFDKLDEKDQDSILEVAEEGICNVNKFADVKEVPAQTTLITTANPKGEIWDNDNENAPIEREELPFKLRLLSRFDSVRIVRDVIDLKSDRQYADDKSDLLEKHKNVDYVLVRKIIEYAKRIEPTVSPDARDILNEYWVQLRHDKSGTYFVDKRTFETIRRAAKAFARLYLSYEVTEEIANRTIEFMNGMFKNFNLDVNKKTDSFTVSLKKIIEFIKTNTSRTNLLTVKDAVERTCLHNDEVSLYVGSVFDINKNYKYRTIRERILSDYPNEIGQVGRNPVKIYWIANVNDSSENPK